MPFSNYNGIKDKIALWRKKKDFDFIWANHNEANKGPIGTSPQVRQQNNTFPNIQTQSNQTK